MTTRKATATADSLGNDDKSMAGKEQAMTLVEFEMADGAQFSGVLLALWWAARGEWERAHEVAQEESGRDGAWVHAYLHRKEGDFGNAAYWYRQAGKPVERDELRAEWEKIVAELLGRVGS